MQEQKKIFGGAVVLTAAVAIGKIAGALFKIPLANLLGGEGMGYFSTAYGLFNPIYAVTVGGFPLALSALVSRYAGCGHIENIRRTYRCAWRVFGWVGVVAFAAIWLLAEPFCAAAGNPGAVYAVRAIAPAMIGCCMMSIWRGYYQGLNRMHPTALSQMVEAGTKLVFGIAGAYGVQQIGLRHYAETGRVFSIACPDAQSALQRLIPFMAAGAAAGVTVSSLCGTLFLFLYHHTAGRKAAYLLRPRADADPMRRVARRLIRTAVPVCLGAAVVSLTAVVDLFSVMRRLQDAVAANPAQVLASLGPLSADVPTQALPNYLYGCYQGMAVSLYTLIPTLTTTFGVSARPVVSKAFASGQLRDAQNHAASVIRMTLILSIPAGIGLCVLAEPILLLLYPHRVAEVAVSVPLLRVLGIGGIFVGLATPMNHLLQAAGKPGVPVALLLGGAAIKLSLNLLLIGNPSLHILGAPIGSFGCYAFLAVGSCVAVCRVLQLRWCVGWVLRPLLAGGCCGLAAHAVSTWMGAHPIGTLCAVASAGCVYLAVLAGLGGLDLTELGTLFRKSKKVR